MGKQINFGNKKYAPVIIPTLNRYEHFKRCLESLERCSGAEHTDVFIGLDYPPSDKYVEGWKLIDEYLSEKEREHGFNKLTVIRRYHNCGIGNPNSNGNLLLQEVHNNYDKYIFSEDDNEFSPNFLEYINWGLEQYEDDNSIYAICGFKDIDTHDINNNVYKLNTIFNAWGYGMWFGKRDKLEGFYDHKVLLEIVKKTRLTDTFNKKVLRASSLLNQIANKTFHGDFIISLLPENEKWCVFPKVNKVRNWGWDGSGTHGGSPEAFKKYSTLPIDMDKHFEPVIVEDLYNPVVLKRFYKKYKTPKKSFFRAVVTFLSYKLIGYIPVKNNKSKWLKVKLQKVQ